MTTKIEELKVEKQYVLKEINVVLQNIILNLKELNEMTESNGTFLNSLKEVDIQIEAMKRLHPQKIDNVDKDNSVQVIHMTLSD